MEKYSGFKVKILILCNHRPDRAPGQRFRFEQYVTYLRANGHIVVQSPIISDAEDIYTQSSGDFLRKIKMAIRSISIRIKDSFKCRGFDIVFIYREALYFGPPIFERLMHSLGLRTILDFDDAIWLYGESNANSIKNLIRNTQKTSELVGLVNLVIVGNNYLANYCKSNGCNNVIVIPTTIDTEEYSPSPKNKPLGSPIVIGWSGSKSTIKHFELSLPFLKQIKLKYGPVVEFCVYGDEDYYSPELNLQGKPWCKNTEINDLNYIDIGIMPLNDNEWTRGKCGLKGLQYMALEIPTLMSPVGANLEIIQHGINGYLPSNNTEWVKHLSDLIESEELRVQLGKAARMTVRERYSYESRKKQFLLAIESLE